MKAQLQQTLLFRLFSVTLACLQNILLGGVFFGWTSISSTMLVSSIDNGGPGINRNDLEIMFVFASFFSNLGPLFLGIVLDNFGPRVCSILSIFIITCGFILFAFSNEEFPLFIPAMCLIAFGGPGAQTSIIHLSNLFPSWKAMTTAVITGCFQLSLAVFYIFNYLWSVYHIDYQTIFYWYALVCGLNVLISVLLWPDQPYSFEEEVKILHISGKQLGESHLKTFRLPSVMMKRKPGHPISLPPIPSNPSNSEVSPSIPNATILSIPSLPSTSSPPSTSARYSIRAEKMIQIKPPEKKNGNDRIEMGSKNSLKLNRINDVETEDGEGMKVTRFLLPSSALDDTKGGGGKEQCLGEGTEGNREGDEDEGGRFSGLWPQLFSHAFLRLSIFFLINSYWANFYMGTLDLQLGDVDTLYRSFRASPSFSPPSIRTGTDEDANLLGGMTDLEGFHALVARFGGLFSLIISVGGVALVPLVGILMDTVGFPATSVVISSFGLLLGICQLIETPLSLLLGFACYAIFRTFLFTYIFAYLADKLGFQYFGILAGILFLVNGCFSLTQYPLLSLVAGTCHSLREDFLPAYLPYLHFNPNDPTGGTVSGNDMAELAEMESQLASCDHGKWQELNILMILSMVLMFAYSYYDWVERRALLFQQRNNQLEKTKDKDPRNLLAINSPYVRSNRGIESMKFSTKSGKFKEGKSSKKFKGKMDLTLNGETEITPLLKSRGDMVGIALPVEP